MIRTKKESLKTYHNQHIQHIKQRKNNESRKREKDKSHIKENPLEQQQIPQHKL
jgi:hypothetical protein